MLYFVLFIFFICLINLNKQLKFLKSELNILKAKVSPEPAQASITPVQAEPLTVVAENVATEVIKEEVPTVQEQDEEWEWGEEEFVPEVVQPKPEQAPSAEPKKKSAFWDMFAGNMTGVIGVAAVVIGVIFLAIYAAISMGPLPRFIVVCAFSAALYVAYYMLAKKEFAKDLALWLRSGSGAIFLAGCLGSSQFAYMRWVNDASLAWALIMLGIGVNIMFGVLNKKELFATLHVVLGLMVLWFIPFSYTNFIVAAIISFIGLLVALGDKKWDLHIMLVNLAFAALNFYWSGNDFAVWPESNVPTIALCLLVTLPCLASHYRKVYQEADGRALLCHLVMWAATGFNLYMHARGTIWGTIGLGIGTVGAFAASHYAHRIKIEWLFICDRLMSLMLGVLMCMSFYKFDMELYQRLFFVSIFSLVFLESCKQIRNEVVFKVTNFVFLGGSLTFLGTFLGKSVYDVYDFVYLAAHFVMVSVLYPSLENYANREKVGFEKSPTESSTFIAIPFALHILCAAVLP